MNEHLNNVILNLIDEHLSINQAGTVELNKPSFLEAIKNKYPELDTFEFEKHLQAIEHDLPSALLKELINEPNDSLSKDDLLAQYQIIKPLAKGGMGEVYLAKRADGQYEKQVALKVLSKGLITAETLQRFQRERQILANLKHPHIVPIVDAGVTATKRPWFVLDYINGKKIDDYCQQHDCQVNEIIPLFLQVCQAVEYAHRHGVIHRDIKPANILIEQINKQPNAMVLDFGIAYQANTQNMTGTGQIMGTPGYMSPEQTAGGVKKVDIRSDVFSLGVMLFELISGVHPFKADSVTETNFNVLKRDPQGVSPKKVSASLVAIILKCLKKDPEARYQTVGALAEDCQRYLNGDPVSAKKINLFQQFSAKIKKYPLVSALSALLLLVLSGAAWLLLEQQSQAQKNNQQMQQYIVDSKELEQQLREQQMLPVHDISPVYQDINDKITALKNQLTDTAEKDQGYIQATIGKSYLLLGQFIPAIEAFNQATRSQFNNDDMQLQFALALAKAWEHEKTQLIQIPSQDQRIQQQKFIEGTYLKPAQEKLKAYLDSGQESTYLQAYLAYLNHNLETAVKLANQAVQENTGLFEAHRLAGKADFLRGKELAIDGKSEKALSAYQQASEYFELATLIGRSDPLSHQLYCELVTTKLHADIIGNSLIERNNFDAAEKVCRLADSILPNQFNVALSLAEIYSHMTARNAELGQYSDIDAANFLQKAQKAYDLNRENTDALSQMVLALIRVSSLDNNSMTDEVKNTYLLQAQSLAEKSVEINDQDAYNWANLADIHYTITNRNIENFDVSPHVNAGVSAYLKSQELLPSYAWFYNVAKLKQLHGDYYLFQQAHQKAIFAYQTAAEYFQLTVDEANEFSTAWLGLASSHMSVINSKNHIGQDTGNDIESATFSLDKACLLYQQKGGLTANVEKTIKLFQRHQQFKVPDNCSESSR